MRVTREELTDDERTLLDAITKFFLEGTPAGTATLAEELEWTHARVLGTVSALVALGLLEAPGGPLN